MWWFDIFGYKRKKRYTHIMQTIQLLYENAADPYVISKKNREYFKDNSTYGEILIPTLLDLIAECHLTQAVFYDLGSGDGKTLFAVKLAYPHFVVRGVEIVPDLVNIGQQQYNAYLKQHHLTPEQFTIDFIHHDLLETDWSDATLIFINATGFQGAFWDKILAKLMRLQPNTKIIVTSKTLPCPPFRLISHTMEKMSWGLTATAIYEKME